MDYLKNIILKSSNICLIFDLDTDGVCSAKIVFESINRMHKEISDFFPAQTGNLNNESLLNGIKNANPDLIIIVDDELRSTDEIAKKFDCNIIVIDHHSIQNMPLKKNIHYFNPKINGSNVFIPASKVCFDLFSKLVDISDLDWVAAIGIISDSGAPQSKEFVETVLKKYGIKKEKDVKYYSDCFFGHLGNIINSGKIVKGNDGALNAFFVLRNSSSPDDFYQKAHELRKYNEDVNYYLKEIVDDFEIRKESYPNLDLYFYAFNPKYKIGSVLSTIVSFKHPGKTVVIFSKKSRIISISYRRQDRKVDMNLLARNSIKGLRGAGGGGHVPAAGGHVLAKDLNMLKRNIVFEIKKILKK